MFTPVPMAQHDATVNRITGYDDCDSACAAGWVKFTVGVPVNHVGECLFEPLSNRKKLNQYQKDWLNKWLSEIGVSDEDNPTF